MLGESARIQLQYLDKVASVKKLSRRCLPPSCRDRESARRAGLYVAPTGLPLFPRADKHDIASPGLDAEAQSTGFQRQ